MFEEYLNDLKKSNLAKIEENNRQNEIIIENKKKLDYTSVNVEMKPVKSVKISDFTEDILKLLLDALNEEDTALYRKAYYKLIDHVPIINLIFGDNLYNELALKFHGQKKELSKQTLNWIFFFKSDFEAALHARMNKSEVEPESSPNCFKILETELNRSLFKEYAPKRKVDYSFPFAVEKLPFVKKTVTSLKFLEREELKNTVAILDIDEKTKLDKRVKAHFADISLCPESNIILFLSKNVMKKNYGCVSEILCDNVKFFCDLDDKENTLTPKSFIDHCRLIVNNFENCFTTFFSEFPEIKDQKIEVHPVALFPEHWKYNSCHLIFEVRVDDAQVCFADASQQKMFWMSFLYLFPDLKSIFDLSVYSKNRYMRLPYSYKNGQYLVRSNLICKYKKKSVKDLFICINDKDEVLCRLDYPCNYSGKQKYWTEFEKREILRNIRNCDKSIAKRKDWLFLISVICSAFKEESLSYCQELIVKICCAGGFSSEMDIKENMEITQIYYDKKPNVTFEKALDFFSANCIYGKTGIYDKIDYSMFPKSERETVLIKSGCNTEKTYSFFKNYRTGTFFVTHRKSLAEDYLTTFKDPSLNIKAVHYESYEEQKKVYLSLIEKGKIEEAEAMCIKNNKGYFIPINFVCQINSIYKYFFLMPYYERFFFDECAASFKMINFCIDEGKNVSSFFKLAFNYILEQKSIFCVSANLGYETFNVLEYYGRKPTFSLCNKKLDKSEYYYELYEDKKEFLSQVKTFLKEGKKVIMPCNNLKVATDFQRELQMIDIKVLVLSRYVKIIETEKWRDYDIVMYTSKIDSGVSYRGYEDENKEINGHFDKICGYFEKGFNDSESCFQSLWRARNPKDKDLHIFISPTYGLKGDDWDKEVNVLKQYHLIKEDLKPIDRLYLDNVYFQNHDRYYFFSNMKRMLDRTGMVNVTHKKAETKSVYVIGFDKSGNPKEMELKEKLPSELIIGDKVIMHSIPSLKLEKTNEINLHKMRYIKDIDSVIFKELDSYFRQINTKFNANLLLPNKEDKDEFSIMKREVIIKLISDSKSDISSIMRRYVNRQKIHALMQLDYKTFLRAFELAKITTKFDSSDEKKEKANRELKVIIGDQDLLSYMEPYRVVFVNDKWYQNLQITKQDLFIFKICHKFNFNDEFYDSSKTQEILDFFIERFTKFNNLFPNVKKKSLEEFKNNKLQHQVQYISMKLQKYDLEMKCSKGSVLFRNKENKLAEDIVDKLEALI